MEPSHQFDLEGKLQDLDDQGQATTLCPVKVKISWNASIGFVREQSNATCPDTTQARTLTISDSGEITAKAMASDGAN